ncbi:hypothetical protein L3Y34_005119 [Caenorhabditis briggsae]|uniref:Uncharacterized protein n=1 Tax=Caenorhabditis briggsae TaxID=6238 RepID=A0AAE9D5V0_CAEBR|nr:hypothetical protein L3Y34_005119 [Caenorhabditis briggsae]
MSKPSKSPSQTKSSSSVGSVCPPTARSLSMMTAEPPTDARLIPTAMSNSVNTAIGGTPSDFESNSGLSDTSAGSGRVSSATSTPKTAQAPTSPEILMNDLRKGSLFGRQKIAQEQQVIVHPQSVTNITFTGTSQFSSFDGKASDQLSLKSGTSETTKTGIPLSGKSRLSGPEKSRKRSPAARISEMKLAEAKQKQQKTEDPVLEVSKSCKKSKKSKKSRKSAKKTKWDDSGKSAKSGKTAKSKKGSLMDEASGKSSKSAMSKKAAPLMDDASGKSAKSTKSGKSKKADPLMDSDFSKKSAKSNKSQKVEKSAPQFGKSGVVKKGDNSVYLPGVMNGPPMAANKFMKREAPPAPTRKFNESPAYNFPGSGQCTRKMDEVAPPTPKKANDQSHCVYDVAQLPPAQRRFPTTKSVSRCSGIRKQPHSLFGAAKRPTPAVPTAPKPQAVTRIKAPTENKIVVFGKTPDGKTTIQMTIDMKVISEAVNGSDQPMTLIPKKVIVGGKEVEIDADSKSEKSL